jgi:hypothetical protein
LSFLMPKAPSIAAPPPPPAPPMAASASVQDSASAARAAAAAASGQGFGNTIGTSPQGAAAPMTAQKTLLGQ